MSPVFSLFQTPRISRRALSPPVCSVSRSSSKCPGVSVPAHPVLGSRGGGTPTGEGRWRRRRGFGGCGSERERVSGRGEEPIPAPLPCHQAKVPRKGGIQALLESKVRATSSFPVNSLHMLDGGCWKTFCPCVLSWGLPTPPGGDPKGPRPPPLSASCSLTFPMDLLGTYSWDTPTEFHPGESWALSHLHPDHRPPCPSAEPGLREHSEAWPAAPALPRSVPLASLAGFALLIHRIRTVSAKLGTTPIREGVPFGTGRPPNGSRHPPGHRAALDLAPSLTLLFLALRSPRGDWDRTQLLPGGAPGASGL